MGTTGGLSRQAILLRLLQWLGYFLLQCAWYIFQRVNWYFTGVCRELCASRTEEGYASSAHLQEVVMRFKFDEFLGFCSKNDFVTIHREFIHPSFLMKDNVGLYSIDDCEAVFVEAEEGVQLWRSERGSFLSLAQFRQARHVITLPLRQFHRFADELGDPDAPLIIMSNTARCGSTLLTQVFEHTDRTVIFSEPDALMTMNLLSDRLYSRDVLVRSVIRVLCKPVSYPARVDAFVIKPRAPSMDVAEQIVRLYPNSKHLFSWRNPMDAAMSMARLLPVLPLYQLGNFIPAVFDPLVNGAFYKNAEKFAKFSYQDFLHVKKYPLIPGVHTFCAVMATYERLHAEGKEVAAVQYEDIVQDPAYTISTIFEYCDLDPKLVKLGQRALDKDSQANSSVNRIRLNTIEGSQWTPAVISVAEQLLSKFGLPPLNSQYHPPGSLSRQRPESIITNNIESDKSLENHLNGVKVVD